MFFKSKNQKRREEAAKCMAELAQAASSGAAIGRLGVISMVECTPAQEQFRKSVESEVQRRLDYQKAFDAHAAAPAYNIASSYDVTKNEDTYHLQVKEFSHGWNGAHTYYRTIYSSTDKAGTEARLRRLTPKVKKAA